MSKANSSNAASQQFKAVWNYILFKKSFTLREVMDQLGITDADSLDRTIRKMKMQNMVKVVKPGIKPTVYAAVLPVAKEEENTVEGLRKANAQKVWLFIRNLETFTLREVEKGTGLSAVKHLHLVMGRMEATKLVRVNRGTKPYRYTFLLQDPPLNCPDLKDGGRKRPRTGHDRMWSALKILKTFTANDLALYSEVSKPSAKRYARNLFQAGYLTRVVKERGDASYSFVKSRDTGPSAPAVYSDGKVYDRNQRKTVFSPKGGQS